jgi:hypothetical protein
MFAFSSPNLTSRLIPVNVNFPDCPQYFSHGPPSTGSAGILPAYFHLCWRNSNTPQNAGDTVRSQPFRIAASNYTEYPGPVGGAGSGPGFGSGSGSAGGKFGSPVPGVSGVGGVVTGSSGRGSGLPGCSGPG